MRRPYKVKRPCDCIRIKEVLLIAGIELSLRDCEEIWQQYSDDACAGWMILPTDNKELMCILEGYL